MLEWIKQNKATAAILVVVIIVVLYGGYQALNEPGRLGAKTDSDENDNLGSEPPAATTEEPTAGTHKDKPATPVVVEPQYVDLTTAKPKKSWRREGVKMITLGDLTIKTIGG